jgi:hypothetical protein
VLLSLADPTWGSFNGGGSYNSDPYWRAISALVATPAVLLLASLLMGALMPGAYWVLPHTLIAATLTAILVCQAVMPSPDVVLVTIFGLVGAVAGLVGALVGGLLAWLWRLVKGAHGSGGR